MNSPFRALIPLSLMLALGCSGDSGPAGDPTSEAPEPKVEAAEVAIQRVVDGIGAGRVDAVWTAMSPAWQKDVNDLAQTFGNSVDPNIWNQIRGAVEKVHLVLDTKAEFIANSPGLQSTDNPEQLKAAIPQVAGLLKTILDATELESLKQFDGQRFFSGPASKLIAQMDALAQLAPDGFSMTSLMEKVTVETVSSEGDRATLKFAYPDDPSRDRQEEFVLVDNHWVPADMAADWESQVETARKELATLPQTMQEQGQMIALVCGVITGALDPLAAAEDQEQFDLAVTQLQSGMEQMLGPMLGPMMSGPGGAVPPGLGNPSPSEFSEVPPGESPGLNLPEAAPEEEPAVEEPAPVE